MPAMPHWLELSPTICHTMETLLYKRPVYANRCTANAVDTLTHEMIHALGVTDEARTECYAMQLSWITAETLGPLAQLPGLRIDTLPGPTRPPRRRTLEDAVKKQTGFFRFDGHRVAYATVGDGRPLVLPAWWVSHVTEDWQFESFRHFIETLATKYRVIRYDRIGTGLSDRERPDDTLTLAYEVELLEALVDHLTDGPVTLFGISCGACSSVAYTVRHPDRVERLVLYGAYACGLDLGPPAARDALAGLVRDAWGLGSRALVDIFVPSVSPQERDAFGAYQRSAATSRTAGDLLQLTYAYDVRDLLPQLEVPTLVLHRDRDRAVPIAAGREVAALVPGARLVTLNGNAHLPWHGATGDALAEAAGFLGLPAPSAQPTGVTGIDELSGREREILGLVAEGLSDAEIAHRLVLSPHTVHRHVANIRRKLGLRSRSAAAAAAARAGLV